MKPIQLSEREFLSRQEAAEYLAQKGCPVSPGTLSLWACTGRYSLPHVKVGRLVRYRRRDIDRWLEMRTFNAEEVGR